MEKLFEKINKKLSVEPEIPIQFSDLVNHYSKPANWIFYILVKFILPIKT